MTPEKTKLLDNLDQFKGMLISYVNQFEELGISGPSGSILDHACDLMDTVLADTWVWNIDDLRSFDTWFRQIITWLGMQCAEASNLRYEQEKNNAS